MGLNLPMLLANSQTLDSWSSAGQYSPPIAAERSVTTTSVTTNMPTNAMRVQIPTITAFPNSTTNSHELSIGARSLFGGSSNNSEPNASPHKAMDTVDIDDSKTEHTAKQERLQNSPAPENMENNPSLRTCVSAAMSATDATITSPIENVNTNEAHLHTQHAGLRQLPQHAHTSHLPHTTHTSTASRTSRERDDLDIKQEFVDYFHAGPTTLPPGADSQRSYSSADELRNSADEYAQDLRVAAAKGLEFGNFVLPRNLRPARSSPTESLEEKYTPLNMRKLNVSSSSSVAAAAAAAAGNVLMNSLLSNESMSEENTNNSARLKRTASHDAAAAAAIYAESLTNRDDCDFVGSNVTLKLRAMDRTQRIIAEKLISEVLFYGQFNELERSARIQPK